MMSPTLEGQIAFIDLAAQRDRIADRINAAIERVLAHGQFILGPEVAELEGQLASFSGADAAVACANGTDALELALRALDLRPGARVIVPSFTFCATAEAVAGLGGIPVFADVSQETFNLDPVSVDAAVQECEGAGHKPVGVIPVDLFGLPADYEALNALAADHGMWVLADSAQSFGASHDGRRVGTLAPITTTSFFPAKPLGCYGDGGAVFVQSPDLAAKLRSLRVHGKGTDKYDNVRIGKNSRLDTIQAAILIEKLAIFEDELSRRQQVAGRYESGLGSLLSVPKLPPGAASAWAQYTVLVPSGGSRQAIQASLRECGVPTAIYYSKPLHRQTAYENYPVAPDGLPVSERLAQTVLSLPMHPYLDADTQAQIVEVFAEILG